MRFAALAVIFMIIGLFAQSYSGVFNAWLSNTPEVYSKPFWYTVTRAATTISYQAEGERYIECVHKAPLTADFRDKYGSTVARELVRRANTANQSPSNIPDIKDNGHSTPTANGRESIIGTPQVDPNPRKFKLNHFIIVTDKKTMEESTDFVLRSECFNPTDGRVLGIFGPFPVPKDGDTVGFFPDVVKKPPPSTPLSAFDPSK